MTEPIDHAAEALNYLGAAVIDTHGDDDRKVAIAAVHAQLAANVIADRANELKRIEILTRFAHVDPRAAREVWARVGDDQEVFAPSIAASLGLGGESDGE